MSRQIDNMDVLAELTRRPTINSSPFARQCHILSGADHTRMVNGINGFCQMADLAINLSFDGLRQAFLHAAPTTCIVDAFSELFTSVNIVNRRSGFPVDAVNALYEFVSSCPKFSVSWENTEVAVRCSWDIKPGVLAAAQAVGIIKEGDSLRCFLTVLDRYSDTIHATSECVLFPNEELRVTIVPGSANRNVPLLLEVRDERGMFCVMPIEGCPNG